MQSRLLEGKFFSAIFLLPGFIFDYFSIDLMHCCDLGILQYLLANVLFDLFLEMGGLVSRPDNTIGDLMKFIRIASKAIGQIQPPINQLTMNMVKVLLRMCVVASFSLKTFCIVDQISNPIKHDIDIGFEYVKACVENKANPNLDYGPLLLGHVFGTVS